MGLSDPADFGRILKAAVTHRSFEAVDMRLGSGLLWCRASAVVPAPASFRVREPDQRDALTGTCPGATWTRQ